MYIVTFYSFKGGTGRSMALMNVAADLLSKGRKVLLVDFDLEAPGLDTFPITFKRPLSGGLVEMVDEYLSSESESTPDIERYVYEASLDGMNSGRLWIMPAGRQDSSYEHRFRSIDWLDLYENKGGFLFFEDLRIQWQEAFQPDYVLVDSRTGHTDIGGICTRQLADCVVAVFFPNEQNLRGLVPVVDDIRREESGPLQKSIDLHFVMSNVPDMDDEESILSRASSHAADVLKYDKLDATIHHFSSLTMLQQRLMVVDRPRSSIANEYRGLSLAIVQQNLRDRDGALAVIARALAAIRSEDADFGKDVSLEKRLQTIRTLHATDAEILLGLARFRRAQRRAEEALDLFDQILQANPLEPESLVGRAEILANTEKRGLSLDDLQAFFSLSHASPFTFAAATRLLIANDRSSLNMVLESPYLRYLPLGTVLEVAQDLQRSFDTCTYGVELLKLWREDRDFDFPEEVLSHELSLCMIAAGLFSEAQEELQNTGFLSVLDTAARFNFAMAEWGKTGFTPSLLFKEFLEADNDFEGSTESNILQCFAIANWAVGDTARATSLIDQAEARFATAPRSTFSCWTYLYRSPRSFREDLGQARRMITSGEGHPAFIRPPQLFPVV